MDRKQLFAIDVENVYLNVQTYYMYTALRDFQPLCVFSEMSISKDGEQKTLLEFSVELELPSLYKCSCIKVKVMASSFESCVIVTYS